MSKAARTPAIIEDDFGRVWSLLKTRAIAPRNASGTVVGLAKRLHRFTYTLIFWRFRLRGLPTHGQVFVEELASDALQVLPHSLAGYNKTTRLLLRSIVENALRHVYFSDHRIEFLRMNREHRWFLSNDQLFEYMRAHPLFIDTEPRFAAVQKLKMLHEDLSAGIHGRRVRDLEMHKALQRIVLDPVALQQHVQLAERCAQATNFILARFHWDQARRLPLEDRRIIMNPIPARGRTVLVDLA